MTNPGDKAPDFILPEKSGGEYRLADALSRGPVVLAFFKADCAACTLGFPYLERLRQSYPGDHWQIWGISQHPPRAAEWFARNTGVTFPLLVDGDGFPVSRLYDPPATPTVYLVDRAGIVLASHAGVNKTELNGLAARLAGLIGERPVVIAPPDDGKPAFRPG
ncbi:MAG: TlpA family protein disulfide reductase [Chloroflexi bacterium]|nr:TlpA family protein disulfide reductase [Chloroflexota bacterium]